MKYPVSRPSLGQDEFHQVLAALSSGQITQGSRVTLFEARFADYLGVFDVVACSSGTAALHLTLAAFGIGPGDEVLVPDLTFIATANAVRYVGATPVFVDVEPHTWNIDIAQAEKKVRRETKAIIPVHLYGCPCNMHQICQFATEWNLLCIEDAAEAIGASWNGYACGFYGDAATFSFYGNKIITTAEGGAVAFPNYHSETIRCARLLRGQGQGESRYRHEALGFNYRMSDLHAAIGLAQLARLDAMLVERRRVMRDYRAQLDNVLTFQDRVSETAPWLVTGLLPEGCHAMHVMQQLEKQGVETRPVFVPMHEQVMYQEENTYPIATDIAKRGISLPTYPELQHEDISEICSAVKSAVSVYA